LKRPFCKQCGKEVAQDARFCPYYSAAQASYAPSSKARQKTSILPIGLIILGFILGVGYTGQDPIHGFKNEYLVVMSFSIAGIQRQNQTTVYTTEDQMNQAINKFERDIH